MNRERAKKLLPIIQAFSEGKKIQAKTKPIKGEGFDWQDICEPSDFGLNCNCDYRIKPELEVIYVSKVNDGSYHCCTDREALLEENEGSPVVYEYIAKKFIEVEE